MKNALFVLITFIILTATWGCKPEKDKLGCYISAPVAVEMRDYIFAPGSYWVYKNDSTGTYDTITVLEVTDTIAKNLIVEPLGNGFQFVRTRFFRASGNKRFSEVCRFNFFERTDSFGFGERCQVDTFSYITYCNQSTFSCTQNPFSNEIFAYLEYIPSLYVQGIYYSEVRKCWGKGAVYNSSCSPWDITTFYAPKNGLIKFTETDTTGYVHSYSLTTKNVTRYEINNPCNL